MSDSEEEPFKVEEEICEEKSDEDRVVVREERYVNEQGKTVIRRVYKKKKSGKAKKKKPALKRSKSAGSKKPISHSGFAGIPKDDDDEVPELQRLKLKSRRRASDNPDDDEDESVPEWQRVKLKSKARDGDLGTKKERRESTVEDDVNNFRRMLRKRDDSPTQERRIEKDGSSELDFRTVLKKRTPANDSAAADTKSDKDDSVPDFRNVLKKRSTPGTPQDESKGSQKEEETPNFRAVLRKVGASTPAEDTPKSSTEEEKPDFRAVLKRKTPAGGDDSANSTPSKQEEVPPWQRVKLRSTNSAASTESVEKPPAGAEAESSQPKFVIGNLRRTEAAGTSDADKARESELKALERRNARLQKEQEERLAKAAQEKDLLAKKLTLAQEVAALEKQKKELEDEIRKLKKKVRKQKEKLA